MNQLALAISIVLGAAPALLAQAPAQAPAAATTPAPAPLTVGDRAPALSVTEWVRGEPITGFEKGKVYVVEFWATWCGPCVRAIPHLTELSKKYADQGVSIVGVSGPDRRGNSLEKTQKMVSEKNAEGLMTYAIAWDNEKATSTAYMKAAGQNGIPTAFIVDRQGVVAFIGSPYEMDEALDGIVKGTWDVAKEKTRFEAEMASRRKYDAFITDFRGGKLDSAYKIAAELVDHDRKDDAGALNAIAWMIVDPETKVERRDVALALRAAERAVELTEGKAAGVLDTLARAQFANGDVAKAIATQERALSVAADAEERQALQPALDEYKAARK